MSKRKRETVAEDDPHVSQLAQLLDSQDFPGLEDFMGRKRWELVIQAWSHSSQTSNHPRMGSISSKMAALVSICDSTPSLTQDGMSMIRDVLENQQKLIYRSLYICRPPVTIPILSFLRAVAGYHKGAAVDALFHTMDFSLKVYPKILQPKDNDQIRDHFLSFYMTFMRNATSLVRKDLVFQKKIISGWMKNINSDPEQMILDTLTLFIDKVVLDPAFSKSTKISLFNDWLINALVKLFNRSDSVPDQVAKLFTICCTDSTYGIRFPDRSWYQAADKIRNRTIFSILRQIKPWEDMVQQNLAVTILNTIPELVAPYFTAISDTTSFDPKLTSFWTANASFYSRVISLPCPSTAFTDAPPKELVVNFVLPAPISRSAVTKGLQHESPLIRFLCAAIINKSLEKLSQLLTIYNQQKWDPSDVLESTLDSLPDLQVVSTCLAAANTELLKTTLIKMVASLSKLFRDLFVSAKFTLPTSYTEDLYGDKQLKGFQLIQAHGSLAIRAEGSKATKWWNKAGTYSTFTNLLRLGIVNLDLKDDVSNLLHDMTAPTLLFQTETLVRPIDVLIHSLEAVAEDIDAEQLTKIWKLVDEAVARTMRSPYKYVDAFSQVRSSDTSVMSPFAVALIEQWKFVSEPNLGVKDWLTKYLRSSAIAGEDAEAIKSLSGAEFKNFDKVKTNNDTASQTLFEFIISADANAIRKAHGYSIVYPLEAQAVKYRVLQDAGLAAHLFPWFSAEISATLLNPKFFGSILPKFAEVFFSTLQNVSRFTTLAVDLIRPYLLSTSDPSVLCHALWLLDVESVSSILMKSNDSKVLASCVQYFTVNEKALDKTELEALLQVGGDSVMKALEANVQKCGHGYSPAEAETILDLFASNSAKALVLALLRATKLGIVPQNYDNDLEVVAAVCRYSDSNYIPPQSVIERALKSPGIDEFAIIYCSSSHLDEAQYKVAVEHVSRVSGNDTVTVDVVKLACALYERDTNGVLGEWFQKIVVWLSKCFSEKRDTLSKVIVDCVEALGEELYNRNVSLWKVVPAKNLNLMMEAALTKWSSVQVVADLVTALVFTGEAQVESTKLLQVILSGEVPNIRSVILLIWKLFCSNIPEHSTDPIEDRILELCNCTNNSSDSLLLDILKKIESRNSRPWVNKTYAWTFRPISTMADDYELNTLTKTKHGFEVTLDIATIRHTVRTFNPEAVFEIPEGTMKRSLELMKNFDQIFTTEKAQYNMEFLQMALVACPDIVKTNDDKLSIDTKVLVESYGLSAIICALGCPTYAQASLRIIDAIAANENDAYRERDVVRLVLGKLQSSREVQLSPCVYIQLALLVPIACNPGHFLYLKATHYLLSGPSLIDDVPLFKEITMPASGTSISREISWFLDFLTCGLATTRDVKLYLKKGVFEWALNLATGVDSVVHSARMLIWKAQEIPGGSLSLLTRAGGLSWSENQAESRNLGAKLGLRFVQTIEDRERVEEWMNNDLAAYVRRLIPA